MRCLALAASIGVFAACHPKTPESPAAATDALFSASGLPALLPTPLPEDPTQTTIHRLSNGMTVYISTDRTTPRISTRVAVRAGGRHDPPDATGLAHYLEHMILFKGSDELGTVDHASEKPHLAAIRELYRELPRAKTPRARTEIFAKIDQHTQAVAKTSIPNEAFNLYATIGASETNAFTDRERTHYVTEIPRNRFEQWARLESERLADPVFRLFYPELEAVYEEKNRALDSAERRQWEASQAALFPRHPYGTQTVLGEIDHLKTPAFDEMVAFFGRWYRPNNMAIIIAGDVDASVLPTLEATFGRLEPKALPKARTGDLAGPKGRVESIVTAPGPQFVRLMWRGVKVGSPDAAVVSVIDRLLDDEQVGLLNVDLELPGTVPWAGSGYEFLSEAGTVDVAAAVRDDSTHAEVEALLRATVGKLASGKTTAAQLQAAKTQIAIDRVREQEYPAARTSRTLLAFTRGETWADVVAEAARVDAVSLKDIQRVAAAIFGDDYVAAINRRGKAQLTHIPKPNVTPLTFSEEVHGALAKKILRESVPPIEPRFVELGRDVEEAKESWGRRVTSRNTRNALFDFGLFFEVGHRDIPLLCHALTVFERSGTAVMSVEKLQFELYRLGTRVGVQCDEDEAAIFIGGIDTNFEASVALLRSWLADPKPQAAVVDETVNSTLSQRREEVDHDRWINAALRNFVYFGDDSPQRRQPSDAALQAATADDLVAVLGTLMAHEHTMLYYGPRTAQAVGAVAPFGEGTRKGPPRHVRRYRTGTASEVHIVHRASAQASIAVLFPGAEAPRSQLALGTAAGIYLGDLAFDEIRGARALAYIANVGVDLGELHDDAAMWGVVQAQPDKAIDAVPALLELMRRRTVEPTRLNAALSTLQENVRSHRADPHSIPLAYAARRASGVTEDPSALVWSHLDAVDVAAVEALAASLTASRALVTIVGDTSKIDLDALAKIGEVTMHQPAALFSYDQR